MSEKVNPQGQVVETKDVDGVDGIIPRLTTDTSNAKVDFAGYLYKEKELDGIVGRMPVIALEDGELIDNITGATIGGEDIPISDGILQLPESYPNAERLNGKADSEFATSEQGVKADSAVQSATIGGITVAKQASELQLPAYPTSLPADGGNADTVDGKHASDFATSAQGGKADIAVQAATIGGVAVIKNGTTLQLPAYPTTLPANGGDADTVDGKHAGDFAAAAHTHTAAQVSGLAAVATSGSYSDLSNKPTIPAAQVNSDWNASGGISQILNKPTSLPANGGNADTVDGLHGAYIMAFKNTLTNNADANTILEVGIYGLHLGNGTNNTNFPKNDMYGILVVASNGIFTTQMSTEYSSNTTWIRTYYNNGFLDWKNITDGGNAVTLGGKAANQFVVSDVPSANVSIYYYSGDDLFYPRVGTVNKAVYRAFQLHNVRQLWGQSFDGTGNVSGDMVNVGSITTNGRINFTSSSNSVITSPYQIYFYPNSASVAPENSAFVIASSAIFPGSTNVVDIGLSSHRFKDGWFTGNIVTSGNVGVGTAAPLRKLHVEGAILAANDWLYTTGNTGWANSTHGGGIYMIDPTWVRVYGGKRFYVSNTDNAMNGNGDNAAIATSGGISAGRTIWAGADVRANGAFYDASDERLKSDIEAVDTAAVGQVEFKQYIKNGRKEVGVIAQQVRQHMPDAVVADESDEAYLSVNYNSIFSAKCALYEKKISMQTEKISDLEKRLKRLEDLLNG